VLKLLITYNVGFRFLKDDLNLLTCNNM